jgi:hypothetical protein
MRSGHTLLRIHKRRVKELIGAIENYQESSQALTGGTAGVDIIKNILSTLPQTRPRPISA